MLLQLTAELAKAGEAAQVLKGAQADLLEQVAQWKERASKGESELRELQFTLQQEVSDKAATQQAHQEVHGPGSGGCTAPCVSACVHCSAGGVLSEGRAAGVGEQAEVL